MKPVRLILPLFAVLALAAGQERVVESVVRVLAYGARCSSSVEMQNLSGRPVLVDVEPHRASGALVPMVGHPEIAMRLAPRERSSYKLAIEEETESAWVKVRERVPSPRLSPVVAITGRTECVIGDQLRTAGREVVYPTQSPWFSGDVTDLPGGLLSLINTSERGWGHLRASRRRSSPVLTRERQGSSSRMALRSACWNVWMGARLRETQAIIRGQRVAADWRPVSDPSSQIGNDDGCSPVRHHRIGSRERNSKSQSGPTVRLPNPVQPGSFQEERYWVACGKRRSR